MICQINPYSFTLEVIENCAKFYVHIHIFREIVCSLCVLLCMIIGNHLNTSKNGILNIFAETLFSRFTFLSLFERLIRDDHPE